MAIVMVIAILAGLMALAAPFVFSMLQQSRAARADLHAMRAREGAKAAVAHGIAQLYTTLRYDLKDESPEVTTLKDLKINMDFPAASPEFNNLNLDLRNPDGTLWSVHVEDEQGKVNVNSAPPALLGNLMGSAVTTEKTVQGDTTLTVDDTSSFFGGGDPTTVKGTVYLEGEVLRYTDVRGNRIVLADPVQKGHSSGALVFDGRAASIVDYPYKGGRRFSSIYEVKMACAGFGMSADEFARIERLITVHSGLDGPEWGHFPLPTPQGPGSSNFIANPLLANNQQIPQPSYNLQADSGIGPGTLLRDPTSQAYGRLAHVTRHFDGTLSLDFEAGMVLNITGQQNQINQASGINGANATPYVEPLQLHPININTAPRDVIVACFKGLCIESNNSAIKRATAEMLTDFILRQQKYYSSKEDLRKVFELAHKAGILTMQERDAAFINATEMSSLKLRTSTVPFCFHSWGTYTIEGSGVENSDNGVQLARNTIRQVVSLPTPFSNRFRVQYQAGFQDLIDRGMTSRVVTFPVAIQKYRTQKDAPELYLPDSTTGDVRLDVGESGLFNLPGEQFDHCNNPQDPGYPQDGYDMRLRDPWIIDPSTALGQNPNQVASLPTSLEMWYRPLGASSCVLYEEGLEDERNRVTFMYDPRHQPVGGMVISIYDAGLECKDANVSFQHLKRKPVEFIYPVTLEAGDWYHLAGAWKTSQPNGQEIRVDAQPVPAPQDGPVVNRPGTKLGSDLGLDDVDTMDLEDAEPADFPMSGAVKVGEEIIEYQTRSGTSLRQLNRGARMSAIAKHSQGELVTPYGYSNPLAQNLRVGGATLSEDLAAAQDTHTFVNMPAPPNKYPFVLDSDSGKIPVNDATNFPPSGYVICQGEVLYYGRKSATTLEQLQRAYKGPARNLHNGAQITLCSVQITNSTQYDPKGIVQIDDENNDKKVEWIYHETKEINNGRHYLLGVLYVANNLGGYRTGVNDTPANTGTNWGLSNFRNQFGIGGNKMAHSKKTKVIPVVRMSGPQCGNQASPYGDQGVSEVSVIQKGATDGDLRYVKQAYIAQYPNFNGQPCPQAKFTGWGFDFYVGLNDFVSRDFPANTTRFLKWPSGELPDAVGAKRHVCSDRNGEGRLQGHVDEWIMNVHNTIAGRIAMTTDGTGIKASDDTINLEDFDAWPQNGDVGNRLNWPATGGLVRIEDELLFYKQAAAADVQFYADVFPPLKDKPPQRNKADRQVTYCGKTEPHPNIHTRHVLQLTGVIRGVLGTTAVAHPVGAAAMLFDGMPVSVLTAPMPTRADTFTVLNGAGFPSEGYALLGNTRYGTEAVSWLNGAGTSFSGCSPFRGRFGTTETDHDPDELVRCLPFRYWDRDAQAYDGAGLAYVQSGYYAPDATWDGIELQLTGTEEQPRPNTVRPRMLVRYDGKPGWDTEPTNQPGGLYEYLYRDGYVPLGGVRANQIELRIYWDFTHGAFQPGLDWKRTFSIERLRGIYHTPLIMRRMEEIERR